jgi:hypothetical protein
MKRTEYSCEICQDVVSPRPTSGSKAAKEFIGFEFGAGVYSSVFREGEPHRVARHICVDCLRGLHELYLGLVEFRRARKP